MLDCELFTQVSPTLIGMLEFFTPFSLFFSVTLVMLGKFLSWILESSVYGFQTQYHRFSEGLLFFSLCRIQKSKMQNHYRLLW